jgi:hypothetical protein
MKIELTNEIHDATFHDGIKTRLLNLRYDSLEKRGDMWCGGPVDMSGSIRLFEAIDPKVKVIIAYKDDVPDIAYVKKGDEWEVWALHDLALPEYPIDGKDRLTPDVVGKARRK